MSARPLIIAANFTADPIQESLGFLIDDFRLSFGVSFAPYDQIFQQLLDPSSAIRQNTTGVNVILVKLDVWLRGQGADPATVLDRNAAELAAALTEAAEQSPIPHFLVVCPSAPQAGADPATAALLAGAEAALLGGLGGRSNLRGIGAREFLDAYPVENYYDPAREALGDIPYTDELFAALGSLVARRARAATAAPYKVLVLDCDNTLWRGNVGDLGPAGVLVDEAFQAWHRFIVRQHEAGMLICLCSKNNEPDVLEVFKTRTDLPLGLDQIVAHRITWEPKSHGLASLAAELNLGLDSFVFVDDSGYEVGEVRANRPEVLAIQFPTDAADIHRLIDHCWAFDRYTVTAEDRKRAESYKQNILRDRVQKETTNLEDFLRKLELVVDVSSPTAETLPRTAQLTQRTNQFNTTTIRRTEAELRRQLDDGTIAARTVHVRDRFGDYGLVGVMLYQVRERSIYVDSFLLSCRVLGRRVEHHMLAELGAIARDSGRELIEFPFVRSAKNYPALSFLKSLPNAGEPAGDEHVFHLAPDDAINAVALVPNVEAPAEESDAAGKGGRAGGATSVTALWEPMTRGFLELGSPRKLVEAVEAGRRQVRESTGGSIVAPRNDTERKVAEVWKEVLRLDQVSVTDNYFDLGGDSLRAVTVFAKLGRAFGVNLPPTLLLQAPTIGDLAVTITRMLEQDPADRPWTSLVPIQTQGSRPPLFCVHAGAGTVLFYYPLARALGADQPVYALQAQGLLGNAEPHSEVEAMARHYIEEMRQVQPNGPYRLAGFCFGGMLAFEMARQLTAAGEAVSFLGSFDGTAPFYSIEEGRAKHHVPPVVPPRAVLPKWTSLLPGKTGRRIVRVYDIFRALGPGKAIPFVTGKATERLVGQAVKMRNRALRSYLNRRGGPVPTIFRRFEWYYRVNNGFAKGRYRPTGKWPGTIAVFTIKDRYHNPDLGWGKFVGGDVVVREITGDFRRHRDLMRPPMVEALADAVRAFLGDAESAAPAESAGASAPAVRPAARQRPARARETAG